MASRWSPGPTQVAIIGPVERPYEARVPVDLPAGPTGNQPPGQGHLESVCRGELRMVPLRTLPSSRWRSHSGAEDLVHRLAIAARSAVGIESLGYVGTGLTRRLRQIYQSRPSPYLIRSDDMDIGQTDDDDTGLSP